MVDFISKKLGGVDLNEGKRRPSPKQFKLAPSQYGMFISLNCKLFLRRSATQHVRGTKGVSTSNAVSERMQLRGSEWEARICEDLALACGSNQNSKYTDCTTLDFPAFVESVLSSQSIVLTHYMYQATLNIDEDGVPAELQKVDASLSRLIPDLLKLSRQSVEDPWTLTVIDAKSSLNLKTSHQAQVHDCCSCASIFKDFIRQHNFYRWRFILTSWAKSFLRKSIVEYCACRTLVVCGCNLCRLMRVFRFGFPSRNSI